MKTADVCAPVRVPSGKDAKAGHFLGELAAQLRVSKITVLDAAGVVRESRGPHVSINGRIDGHEVNLIVRGPAMAADALRELVLDLEKGEG